MSIATRLSFAGILAVCAAIASPPVHAQVLDFNQAFSARANAVASGEEIVKQPNLFVMQVEFRPLGIVKLDVTNPKTGKVESDWVWYLVWRAANRKLETPADNSAVLPDNSQTADPIPGPKLIPEFFLIVEDAEDISVHEDEVMPEAVAAIAKREKLVLKNSIDVIQPVPPAIDRDPNKDDWIYGVATWRGINPNTDYFTILASGFSNGYTNDYEVGGEKLRARKTISMRFWRPGDEYDQSGEEVRPNPDDPKVKWIYRPEGIPSAAPQTEAVSTPANDKP